MQKQKPPLFRKLNTTAYRANFYRLSIEHSARREAKKKIKSGAMRLPMHSRDYQRDYTPLFEFLLAKVGQPWSKVHSEAVNRLDREEPIYWLVALRESERQDYVRVGESSYYSGLYVDQQGLLQRVNPSIGPSSLEPFCKCCTHTFNGVRFTRSFQGLRSSVEPDSEA